MGGRRKRTEGIYASTDSSQLLHDAASSDLGLTLFPGSQTQRQDEYSKPGSSHELNPIFCNNPEDQKGKGWLQGGKLQWADIALTLTESVQGEATNQSCGRDDDHAHGSAKRRRLDQWRRCSSFEPSSRRAAPIIVLDEPEVRFADIARSSDASPNGTSYEAGEAPAGVNHRLGKAQHSNMLSKVCPSGHASASDPTEFGILLEESCNSCSFNSPEKVPHASESAHQSSSITDDHLNGAETYAKSFPFGLSALKRPEEPQRSSPCVALELALPNSPRNLSQQATLCSSSSAFPESCRTISGSRTRVLRSWTSHFPKASKRPGFNCYARRPAPFSPADFSFNPNAIHQQPSTTVNPSTESRRSQQPLAIINYQNSSSLHQHQSSLQPSTPDFENCVLEHSPQFVIQKHQQRSTHKRTISLPREPTTHCAHKESPSSKHHLPHHLVPRRAISLPVPPSTQQMDSIGHGTRSVLRTPSSEQQSLSSYHQPSNSYVSPAATPTTVMNPVNDISNASNLSTSASVQRLNGYNDRNAMPVNTLVGGDVTIYRSGHMLQPDMASYDRNPQPPMSQASYSNGAVFPTRPQQSNNKPVYNNTSMSFTVQQNNSQAAHNSKTLVPNLQQPKNEATSSNGTARAIEHRPNLLSIPQKTSYSLAEVKYIQYQIEQAWNNHCRQERMMAQHQASAKYKRYEQQCRDQVAQKDRENDKLKQDIEAHKQNEAALNQHLQSFMSSEMYRHFHDMYNSIQTLELRTSELDQTNKRLLAEMQIVAAKQRPNAAIAHDILHSSEPLIANHPASNIDRYQHRSHNPPQSSMPPLNVTQTRSPAIVHTTPASSSLIPPSLVAPSQLMEEAAATFPNGCIDPRAITSTNSHLGIPPFTNNPQMPSIIEQVGPDPAQHPGNDSITGALNSTIEVASDKVTIDLTDDPMPQSDPCNTLNRNTQGPLTHAQHFEVQAPKSLQSQAQFAAEFSRKDLTWLDGNHPGKIGSTYNGLNFGLPSNKKSPPAQPSKAKTNLSKHSQDIPPAVVELSPEQKQQRKRARQSEYNKNYKQKKRAEKALAKQSGSSSLTAVSAVNSTKQARKSAKRQKRQDRAQESLEQVQRQVTQEPDARSQEQCSDAEGDTGWDRDPAVESSNGAEATEGTDDEANDAFAAEIEAHLMADAEAELEESNRKAVSAESHAGETAAADIDSLFDDDGYQEGWENGESEESEEE